MARYKPVHRDPLLLPVVLADQVQPGTFEFALDHLVDHELDLSAGVSQLERWTSDATAVRRDDSINEAVFRFIEASGARASLVSTESGAHMRKALTTRRP